MKRLIMIHRFFQQWTGINAILYYAPTIFTDLGLSNNTTSLLASGVVGILIFVSTIPAVLYVDRLGRKPILTVGAIGMATWYVFGCSSECLVLCSLTNRLNSHIIVAILVAKNQNNWPAHPAAGWAAIAMVWLFIVHFGYSWGPCAWIIVSEVWPLSNRPYGIALGASSNWMNNFIVGQVTPDMLTSLGYGTYILFGLLTYLGAAFIWFYVPETKRLTLEEMDTIFGSEGTAQADFERMEEINREIGLETILRGESAVTAADDNSDRSEKGEKGV
jgi:MFS family permease